MLFLQVKLSVFWEYAKSLTVPISVCIVLFFILSETSAVSSGIWLAKWSSTDVTSDDERDLFLGVYGALGLSQAIFILFASIAMAAGSRVASRYLHQKMLVNIMHSPMSLFETTPQGRIMNRFSKDISGIDDMVPRSLTSFLRTFLSVIGTMFAITFATPIFLAVIIPLGALYFFIQVRPLFAWNPVNRFSVYDNMIENFTCHFKINLVVFVFHYCFEIEMLFDPSSIFRRWRLFIIWNLPAKRHTDYKALWKMFSLAKQFSPKFHCSFLYRLGCSLSAKTSLWLSCHANRITKLYSQPKIGYKLVNFL